jgi:hypothetical protein
MRLTVFRNFSRKTKRSQPDPLISHSTISRLVIGTSRTVGSAKKFVRITSGFGGGEFTKTLRKVVFRGTIDFARVTLHIQE